MIRHERVARIFARGDRREREAIGHVHRHILERMDREIGAAVRHRHFELLDEEALAADVRERPILHSIALGRQPEQRRPRSTGYSAASRARMCSACQSASADCRVAIVSRRGASPRAEGPGIANSF